MHLRRTPAICGTLGRAKSNRWQRSTTVGSTLAPRSWRARRSCAAAAPRASSGTRSMAAATACAPRRGCRPCGDRPPGRSSRCSRRSRMSSTELLDAASISITSSDVALAIEAHDSHWAARARPSVRSRSSARPRGSSPSRSCPCPANRRTGTRGGPCPARSRCAGSPRRGPGRPRLRTFGGRGGGRAKQGPWARDTRV